MTLYGSRMCRVLTTARTSVVYRLFRREAFNVDSLERTIDRTDYDTYSKQALRVFENSRRSISERDRSASLTPRLSPKAKRLKLSDALAKPEIVDWKTRVANRPKVWKTISKEPFYHEKPSMPDISDYASQKHRIAFEMR